MARVDQWLTKYACGPGRHVYRDTGLSGMPEAMTVQPGQPLATYGMESMTKCERCEKTGWNRTQTCEICDWYPAATTPNRVLVLADGTRLPGLPLCDSCHIGAIEHEAGLSIEWQPT